MFSSGSGPSLTTVMDSLAPGLQSFHTGNRHKTCVIIVYIYVFLSIWNWNYGWFVCLFVLDGTFTALVFGNDYLLFTSHWWKVFPGSSDVSIDQVSPPASLCHVKTISTLPEFIFYCVILNMSIVDLLQSISFSTHMYFLGSMTNSGLAIGADSKVKFHFSKSWQKNHR